MYYHYGFLHGLFYIFVKYNPILIMLIASIIDNVAIFFKIYNNEKPINILIFFIIQCFIIHTIILYLV